MDTVFTGRIWKLPDDVDTDTIIPGRYGVLPSAEEMSRHCLEPLRPELAAAARPGDIFVAGKNFGCGSSREFAPACIAALGVRCIVAKSFARIFYRNGINNGMLLIETDDLYDRCEEGDLLTVEVNRCLKVNGQVIPIRQIPDNLFEIIKAGGLVPRYRALNEAAEAAESVQKEVQGTPLNEAYIGSCTNGSLEDMAVAARILQGHHVAPYLKLIIIPASIGIYRQCMRLGYIRAFVEAGAMVAHPCCGLCCGQPYGLMSDGEVILGTNNRNFIGRMGTTKSLIYLSSPATAAASALTGVITDPRTVTAD